MLLSRRAFLGVIGAGAAVAAVGTGVAGAYDFRTERVATTIAGLTSPVRIAWMADIHYGVFIREGSVEAWVTTVLDEAPDLVILGGDLVDHTAPDDLSPLLAQLARLRAPLGVYAVWGNQDYARHREPEMLDAFEHALADAGVTVLVNRGVALRDDLFLGGVDADRVGPNLMRIAVSNPTPGSAVVLAAHKPKMIRHAPSKVDLTLCGHTHGGQIVLPGIGPIADRSELGMDQVAGWIRAPGLAYISRGLGVTHVPVRVNCPGELTIVTLSPPS